MEPEEYRRRSLATAATTAALVRTYFEFLPNSPDDTTWARFVNTIYDQVMLGRFDAFNLAIEFYNSQRPTLEDPPEFVERTYPSTVLDKALKPARARLVGLEEFEAEERRLAADAAESITARQVVNAGRNAIEDAVRNDSAAIGWARLPSGAETCAFCMMIISRGPAYKTAGTAGRDTNARFEGDGLFKFHNNDDCLIVAVFDRDNYPGRDDYLRAQSLWNDVTGGYTGADALNALRRHLYASNAS